MEYWKKNKRRVKWQNGKTILLWKANNKIVVKQQKKCEKRWEKIVDGEDEQ